MQWVFKIWDICLASGVEYVTSRSYKTRLVNANRMGAFTLFTCFLLVILFAVLRDYVLIMILTVFISMLILAFVICNQNWIKIAKFLYVFVPCFAIFIFANIFTKYSGIHYYYFCIIPPIFTYYTNKEKGQLFLTLALAPAFWLLLELSDFGLFTLYNEPLNFDTGVLNIVNILFSFGFIFLYLYQFMNFINRNQSLLTKTIKSLTIKEKELRIKNDEFSYTTKELIGIQQLLSSNQSVLKEEKDKAEKANRVKSDFLSSMSHEIRTPMNVIVGLTDLLIDSEKDNEKLENLELIKNSSNNLLVIINDILDFSKMNSGKLIIENVDFNLYKKVKEAVRIMSIKESGNEIRYNISPDTPEFICSDPVRLNQIFINLLSNAIKFTNKGLIELNVSINNFVSDTNVLILFEVRDTGIGMNEKEQLKIFDSFTQASSSTTRRYGGTGLGLPICKHIVELMDGKLWVESVPNVGSSFFFELPFKCKPVQKLVKCLVTEDFEMNQMMIEHTLENLKIQPHFVSTKEELEKELHKSNYDFLLIDFTKDDLAPDDIKEVLDLFPSLEIPVIAFDNFYDKESVPFETSYISEPINNKEILMLQKNNFRSFNA